jgi:hypothetical protein
MRQHGEKGLAVKDSGLNHTASYQMPSDSLKFSINAAPRQLQLPDLTSRKEIEEDENMEIIEENKASMVADSTSKVK